MTPLSPGNHWRGTKTLGVREKTNTCAVTMYLGEQTRRRNTALAHSVNRKPKGTGEIPAGRRTLQILSKFGRERQWWCWKPVHCILFSGINHGTSIHARNVVWL